MFIIEKSILCFLNFLVLYRIFDNWRVILSKWNTLHFTILNIKKIHHTEMSLSLTAKAFAKSGALSLAPDGLLSMW